MVNGTSYHEPCTIDEAVTTLTDVGDTGIVISGGTSVMVMRRLGLFHTKHIVSLRGVQGLDSLMVMPAGQLRIGSMVRLRKIETAPAVKEFSSELASTIGKVATVRIRNQATIGGSLAHADPAQDPPPMLMVLNAVAEIHGATGSREIPVEDLFSDYFETRLAPNEIITAITVPKQRAETIAGYTKFLPRTKDDYATAAIAVAGEVVAGRWAALRIACGALAATPVRARTVEEALLGEPVEDSLIAEAAQLVRGDIDPLTDGRGSAEYKSAMAAVLLSRLLSKLAGKAAE